jgi:cation diffusion facilitator CzcD-associated flavoprotein CzcO
LRPKRFAVIGAGMSGILAAIKLKERGIAEFTLYEKAASVGGTWRDNIYPGLVADAPSHAYCYSFALKPDWERRFASGQEILEYLQAVADKYGIERHIRFNSEAVSAEYSSDGWMLRTHGGDVDLMDFVICATGFLHRPIYPRIAGLDSFSGTSFHSARWDRSQSLLCKRVGIIGTGASAIQIVPAIADRIASLWVFQRTANWIMPKANPTYTQDEKALYRASPEALHQSHEFWLQAFYDRFERAVVEDGETLAEIKGECEANLHENVHDPELRRKLTPTYPLTWKRLFMSDSFYPTLQRPNVHLVTEPIQCVEPGGVRTAERFVELDVLVLATGFDSRAFMRPMSVIGDHGRTLANDWAEAPTAYRSVGLPGFPNFFMLVGPNSPRVNISVVKVAEAQIEYILRLAELVRCGKVRAVVPKDVASKRHNAMLDEAVQRERWWSNGKAWYLDETGRRALWPWSRHRFFPEMQSPDLRDFDLLE